METESRVNSVLHMFRVMLIEGGRGFVLSVLQ